MKTGTNFKCLSGDDASLLYTMQCLDCGTIVLDDHSSDFACTDWKCPVCVQQKNFGFIYFTERQQFYRKIKAYIVSICFKVNKDFGLKMWYKLLSVNNTK